ncbi:MAG: hypothetical protein ACE5EY_07320 [Anaerolineae bacterium]
MTLTILQTILTAVSVALIDNLIAAAITGLIIGMGVGALVMPMIQDPDTMIRGILVGVFGALAMSVYQVYRISQITGSSMGSILDAFQGSQQNVLGPMILNGFLMVLLAIFIGMIIGTATAVPDKVIKGGIIGLFVGAALSVLLTLILDWVDLSFSQTIYRIIVGVLSWGVMSSIVSKNA